MTPRPSTRTVRIGVVAPACRIEPALADAVVALAAEAYPDRTPEIVFDPQCFLSHGHFAGEDAARAAAFLRVANDPSFDALWVARGGYGAARLIPEVMAGLQPVAREKIYLGYSDAGALWGAMFGMELFLEGGALWGFNPQISKLVAHVSCHRPSLGRVGVGFE